MLSFVRRIRRCGMVPSTSSSTVGFRLQRCWQSGGGFVDENMQLDRNAAVGQVMVKDPGEPDEQPEVSFATLLRHSKFMQLGDFDGRMVIGQIVHRTQEDLYIDFGGKFNAVCKIPAVDEESYLIDAKVIIRLHDFELSERFLGAKRDITLLEADATLIRLYQRREDSVERSNLLEGDRPAPWQRRGQPRPPDVRERLRNLSEQKRQQQPEMLVDVPENLPDKRAGQSTGNKTMPWARTAGGSGLKPDISVSRDEREQLSRTGPNLRKFDEYLPKQKQQSDNQRQLPSDFMDRPVKKVLETDAREQQKTRQQWNRKPSTGEERQSSRSSESARPFAPPEASTNERHKPWQRRREEMEKSKPPGLGFSWRKPTSGDADPEK